MTSTALASFLFVLSALRPAQGVAPASQYYDQLGCDPPQPGQPNIYNCSILDSLEGDKCFFNKRAYEVEEKVRGEDVGSPCIHQCDCHRDLNSDVVGWRCVQIECPELFNPPPPAGCTRLYQRDKCCSTGTYCPKEAAKAPVTCSFEGKTYVEGEKFHVDGQCLTCICQEGFNGSLTEPWCSKLQCDLHLHYGKYIQDGCVPTYFETDSCCPVPIWRCPKENDTPIIQKNAADDPDGSRCKFGDVELRVGEVLSPSEDQKCVECKCLVPPHLSCLMNTTCYNSH